jgi:hypothetical protein
MLLWSLLPTILAHSGDRLDGIDVHEVDGAGTAVEASFGLVWQAEGDVPRWHCHEALTQEGAAITPRYALSSDGVMLGLISSLEQAREPDQALYRSTDGCTWNPVLGLEGRDLSRLAFSPIEASRVFVSSNGSDGDSLSGVFASVDGGQSFEAALLVESRAFGSVEVSVHGVVWASASVSSTEQAWLYTSPDGISWSEHEVPLRDLGGMIQTLDVVASHPTDPLSAWLVAGPFGNDVLLRTYDGGESFEQLFQVDGDILDASVDTDGGVWLAVSGRDYYYAADGEHFLLLDGAPRGMGLGTRYGETVLAVDGAISGHLLARPTESGYAKLLELSTIEAMVCPEDSHGAVTCDPLWEELSERLIVEAEEPDLYEDSMDTSSPDSGAPTAREDDRSCGCESKSSMILLVPFLAFGARRRSG